MSINIRLLFVSFFLFSIILAYPHPTHAETPSAVKVVHVYVSLADNQNQGIVPIPAKLGNGQDAGNNLYWGALYGVKTYLKKSTDWIMLTSEKNLNEDVLERVIFRHKEQNVYLIADAYQGKSIKYAIQDFLKAASGKPNETVRIEHLELPAAGNADMVVYIGHNGLMDFGLSSYPKNHNTKQRDVIILACLSKPYFSRVVEESGAYPLLWTTNLLAPEAYILKAALDGWILHEKPEQVRERAAKAYHDYQKCSLKAARKLLVTGW